MRDGAIPNVVVFNAYEQTPKLTESALQKAGIFIQGDETDIYVRLQNRSGEQVDSWIGQDPRREDPSLLDAFYSQVCQKEVLVLVIQKRINTAITSGNSYFNALFDPGSGGWIATLRGAKVKDKETDEWFVDSQKALLATLATGMELDCSLLPAER
ncbi:hypothetical protein [Alkalimonas amylolytica]|uniref:hypothetical protein n=1 Tax=Alkalimonas amylolytica TaxID=152573 RepID=UPI001114EB4D|nr:hypothetical protein [Alkalimonas amylolytica]